MENIVMGIIWKANHVSEHFMHCNFLLIGRTNCLITPHDIGWQRLLRGNFAVWLCWEFAWDWKFQKLFIGRQWRSVTCVVAGKFSREFFALWENFRTLNWPKREKIWVISPSLKQFSHAKLNSNNNEIPSRIWDR